MLVAVAPVAPVAAPLGGETAPALAPAAGALAAAPVVSVVLVLGIIAPRMSINTTVSPLLAMFRKVPAMAGMPAAETLDAPVAAPVAAAEVAGRAPVAVLVPSPAADVNVPDHWFWVSSC